MRASERSGPSAGLWSWGVFLLATLWLLGTVAAPWLAAREHWSAAFFYWLYQPICHQQPARSFWLFDHQLAACHRCVGLYVGFVVGLIVVYRIGSLRRRISSRPWILIVFALPMLIDVSLGVAVGGWNHAWGRFGTGFLAAFPLALLAQFAARQLRTRGATAAV